MTRVDDDNTQIKRLEHILAGQAQRDRRKLVVARAEIEALSQKIAMLEGSLSRRAGAPARHAIRLLRRLLNRPAGQASVAAPVPARAARGRALVIDHHWPRPDRDSGSVDIVNLVQALAALGFDTILAASQEHEGKQPAREKLIEQGVRCLQQADAESVDSFIQKCGLSIDICFMCRVFCGGAFLERLQRHAPQARLVFNSIDLNYLREERRAQLQQDDNLTALLPKLREREEHLIRSSDATFVVSTAESDLLRETMPGSLVVQMPLARRIHMPSNTFAQRAGIGFIGGFSHAPNVDAVRYFLKEIWPSIQKALPDCELSIVGSGAPSDLADGYDKVRILGHLADVGPWFERLRATIAPLRYGAGAKGKVATSLAHGVPCILTSVASEGMSLTEQDGAIVQDKPEGFAEAVVAAYTNEKYWSELSFSGLSYAQRTLSFDAWQSRLDNTLCLLGI